MPNHPKMKYLPFVVWLFGSMFFLVDYIVRVSPSVLTPTLMTQFHADAFAIGGFAGFFYYAYISMQIPVGVLVDRFGPKKLLVISTAICAISTFMFASMDSLIFGYISRLLLGFGAAFAFVGTLKLISLWFSAKRFALLAGITQALGMVGATIGQGPMATLYQNFGWRSCMYGLAIFFVILCLLILFIVRDANPYLEHTDINTKENLKIFPSLCFVLKSKQTWLNCFYIGLLYGPTTCFGEQWGASFLAQSQGISIEQAGHQTGILFIGLAVGCPILGYISDILKRRLIVMRASALVCLITLFLIIYIPNNDFVHYGAPTILFIFGFFNSGIVISYALAAEINRRQYTGMALGLTNMLTIIIGAVMIPIVGFILDHLWNGIITNGVHTFAVPDYQLAFIALPIGLIIAFLITFFQRETFCKYQLQ